MPALLAALFFFAILTLWVPAYWPVAVFQIGVFALAAAACLRALRRRVFPFSGLPPSALYPLFPLSCAVLWGLLQLLSGRTAYPFDTQAATVRWAAFLAVFSLALSFFRHPSVLRRFRSAMLWFAFLVSVLATLQTFTAAGDVFWLFPTGLTDYVMGPILSRNHYAAFIEAVLPFALFEALRRERDSLLWSAMAAAMYASVVASASRAGTVLATAEIFLAAALMWYRGRASGRAVGSALLRMALFCAALTLVVGWEAAWARLWAPDPVGIRRELNISSLRMAAAHPWLGVGLGAWPDVYPRYAIVDIGVIANQAHDDWLQWAAEGGFPFALLLASLFLWSLRPAFRSVWGLGVVAVFLHACVDYPFSRPALGSWPVLVLAMLAAHPISKDITENNAEKIQKSELNTS